MKVDRRRFLAVVGAGLVCARAEADWEWNTPAPEGCPAEPSKEFLGLTFTGRHAEYTKADTWYPSWAADGNLYSPWTDGSVDGVRCSSNGSGRRAAHTGAAKILGDDPMVLQIVEPSVYPGDPKPYAGRYPCGSLVHNGVWYYGTYCLNDSDGDPRKGLNWDILGPLVGFRNSTDFGKTWTDTPHTPASPLFGEPAELNGPVKFGAPHFVDFGCNMQHSPDDRAYLCGHGAVAGDPHPRLVNLSWGTGDQIYLCRVKPSIKTINDRKSYEFFAGRSKNGKDQWARDLASSRPIFEWNNNAGCVTMTYNVPLRKYLMCVTDAGDTIGKFNTYILESKSVTGPWLLVVYLKQFGEQAYFVNIPSKFMSSDGLTFWLCYSANFTNSIWKTDHKSNPPGGRYGMCLQEVRLRRRA